MPAPRSLATPPGIRPIVEVAERLGIPPEALDLYGRYKTKVVTRLLESAAVGTGRPQGRLIMVTAMTPTKAGEGKTTTAIGLADALSRLGKRAAVALREPSLGPVFGMKGGATGGGAAKVHPSADINLHFTGDIHAVSTAHNLLAAMADNRLHFDGAAGPLDPRAVAWNRVVDMNDRALRDIVIGLGGHVNGVPRESGYSISTASEVMAIFCLSKDLDDLKQRLGRICVGFSAQGAPVFARDIKASGAMAALLKDALNPNLVQTLEGTPAFIHGGPFANIAHGTNSIAATRLALGVVDYLVTETGFASDLGAEKFFDIVVRTGLVPPPSACVLVATLRALKLHGGVKYEEVGAENAAAVEAGFDNLRKHIENMRAFGTPFVVALNLFPTDAASEIDAFERLCRAEGVRCRRSDVYGKGGLGGIDLAEEVLAAVDGDPHAHAPLYPDDMPILKKVETVARTIYGADGIVVADKAKKKIASFEKAGFARLPVCVAKTQYSLSDDDKKLNRPRGFRITVTDASLSSGAGFVVVLCGDVMVMPGLPRVPSAEHIDVTSDGEITGITG